MKKIILKINDYLAEKMSIILASMWCFWVLLIFLILSAVDKSPDGVFQWVMFLISAAFQAVALPILAYTSNKQTDRIEELLNKIDTLIEAKKA